MQITEILSVRSLDEASVLQAAYIYDIVPTDASKVLKLLGEKIPLSRYNWNHVKRIRKVVLPEDFEQSDESIVVVGSISPTVKEKKEMGETKEQQGDANAAPKKDPFRLQVLLCPVSDFIYISEEVKTLLNIHTYPSANDFCSMINVANTVPLTRTEYDAWNIHWPIYYRPTSEDRDRSKGLMDHSAEESEWVEQYMRCVLQDGSNVQLIYTTASTASSDDARKAGNEEGMERKCSGGVVVNPLNGAVAAASCDYFYYYQLERKHAHTKGGDGASVMKRAKGGPPSPIGVCSSDCGAGMGSKDSEGSDQDSGDTMSARIVVKREKLLRVHPLMDAPMRCIEVLARIAREEGVDPGIKHPIWRDTAASALDTNGDQEGDKNDSKDTGGSGSESGKDGEGRAIGEDHYLLTGLDVFLEHEPDIFLAMALVHSRIRKLYYLHADSRNGAIESNYQLHTNHNLNHRYRAFRVEMEKDDNEESV